jgi:tetratricopeptide (TPR) repeat protein
LIHRECQSSIARFRGVIRSYLLFHLSFAILFIGQIALLTSFITQGSKSFGLAASIALFLLSFFSYVVLIYYFQGKKGEQFREIQRDYFALMKKEMPVEISLLDYHLNIANSAFQLTTYLYQSGTYTLSLPPFRFNERLTVHLGFLLNWRDIQKMQEILMSVAIKEHIQLIKTLPVNLAVHTSLANTFIALAKIYDLPDDPLYQDSYLIKKIFSSKGNRERFQFATNRAIEELKVLDDLAPNDPWIHAALASCYHHLEMLSEEIHEYEVLVRLRPDDKDILLRLGLLYFETGKMALGLRIYEKLSRIDAKSASDLIKKYDTFMDNAFSTV